MKFPQTKCELKFGRSRWTLFEGSFGAVDSRITTPIPAMKILSSIATTFFTAVAASAMFLASAGAQQVTLVINNQSPLPVTFTPQITTISSATNGTPTITTGSTPVVVAGTGSNSQVSVNLNATALPITVTLQLDGTFNGRAFSFIQCFGVTSSSSPLAGYVTDTVRPFSGQGVITGSAPNFVLTLTIPPTQPAVATTETKWSVKGTIVQKDGQNFFAKGMNYAPTPIGGATYQPGVGDWTIPPWWTFNGDNTTNDIGARDIPLLKSMGVNALRTYFTWYWMIRSDNNYLASITQTSPMTVVTDVQYPYTVFFNHEPFLDACFKNGIYVVLGIAINPECWDFSNSAVNPQNQNFYIQTAQKLATLYGKHPAVMGFCIGNEQNQGPRNDDSRTYLFYQALADKIKAAAPDKLVTIAFQDDQTLYNGTLIVKDLAGQSPPTPFNNVPVEQAISSIVDVWGLNIYSGISTDFPIFETNVVKAKKGAYARPLWVTEWGTPSGNNVPAGQVGPPTGNATTQAYSEAELKTKSAFLTSAIGYMNTNLSFVAGAFYFEFCDEWWKVDSIDPKLVNKAISPLDPATGKYKTNGDGKVTLLDGSTVFPAYTFTHDGSNSAAWPEENWGLYGAAISGGRQPFNPDSANPDTLSPRQPFIDAITPGYAELAKDYGAVSTRAFRSATQSAQIANSYGHVSTPWGVRTTLSNRPTTWFLDPFGRVEVINNALRGPTVKLLDWGGVEAFLPKNRPNMIYFPSLDEWQYIVEDEGVTLPDGVSGFRLIPPSDAADSEGTPLESPFEQTPIPAAPTN